MAEAVFFSVLIPVYNVEPYLRECLDSILSQGWEKLELIAVDDGSTDRSGAICDEYAARDGRVRVIHRENGGLMSARRCAIAQAKGDYVLFADSDDRLLPGALAALDRAIGRSGADCLIFGAERETPNGIVHNVNPPALCGRVITVRHEVIRLVLNDNSYNVLWRKCARRTCFDGRDFSPWFHISRGEDLIQSTELLENARSFYFMPEELYFYRMNAASITHTVSFDGYRAGFELERFQLCWLKKLGIFDEGDYDHWRNHLLDELVIELKRICRFCSDRANAVAAMESILAADFYRDFLAAGYRGGGGGARRAANRFAVGLLQKRRFDALRFFCARVYRGR